MGEAKNKGPEQLLVSPGNSHAFINLPKLPNVFSDARAMGFNTGMVGSNLPYCRLLTRDLTQCWWHPASDLMRREEYYEDPGVLKMMWLYARRDLAQIPLAVRLNIVEPNRVTQALQVAEFQRLHERAVRMAADPQLDFVLLHWPVPHPRGIYDSRQNRIAIGRDVDYIDNLELADSCLGDLRAAMEKSGLWARSILLVSTDHHFRIATWRRLGGWSAKLERVIDGGGEHLEVPFILHFPGQTRAFAYEKPFNIVLTRQLLHALERREITSPAQTAVWLDEHRTDVPAPVPHVDEDGPC